MMLTAHNLVMAAKAEITEMSSDVVLPLVESKAALLIDVREPDEYHCGHLPGAVCIPRGLLEFKIGDLPGVQQQAIVVYCKTGGRAALAAQTLQKMGYSTVRSLSGGFDAWLAQHLPVEQEQQPSFD